MTITYEYSGDQFLIVLGESVVGGRAVSSLTDTLGLAGWARGASVGATAVASIQDAALLMYGVASGGSVASSEYEEDIIFTPAEFYGAAAVGAYGKARAFIDPYVPGQSRYLPEGQSS